MKPYAIYWITHIQSGMIYVGITGNPGVRWRQHKKENRYWLGNSIKKHGVEAFSFLIQGWIPSLSEALQAERQQIAILKTLGVDLFNLTSGGEGVFQPSEKTRIKKSLALKGRIRSPEHCKKLSQARTGMVYSEETRRKMSISAKNRPPVSDETRRKLALPRRKPDPFFYP